MEKQELSNIIGGSVIGAVIMKNNKEVPQKIKNATASLPHISTYGYISEKTQNIYLKEYMKPYAHWCIIHNSQDMKAIQVPSINEWMKFLLYNGIMLSH